MTDTLLRLEDVCRIVMGQAPKGESYNFTGNGLPLIAGAGDFGDRLPSPKKFTTQASKVSKTGDVILGIRASIGTKVWADAEYCLGRGVAALRPKGMLKPAYLWHWLTHAEPALSAKARGATFKQVNRDDIASLEMALPPLDEQQRIADILDKTDSLRALRQATLIELDRLTQSIFIDLFGDPVANPKEWPEQKLGSVLTFQQYGPRFYNEMYSDDGIRIVRITDLDEAGTLRFSKMPRMLVPADEINKYALRAGDLIFARTGATVGKVALIGADDPPCIAGAYFITMRFEPSLVEPVYARAVLVSPSIRAIVVSRSRQAAQQNFSGPGLRDLTMPLPPIALQQTFARRIAAVEQLKSRHRAALAELDTLFASLQHRAFRGEL